jgi:hypothetical protein
MIYAKLQNGMKELISFCKKYKSQIDDSDFEWLSKHSWWIIKSYHCVYFATLIDKRKILLHRLLVPEVPNGMVVDHDDGNSLNNQRYNLKIITHQENCLKARVSSSSKLGIRGISKLRHLGYVPNVWVGKKVSLGTYKTIQEAVEVRNKFIVDNKLKVQLSIIPDNYETY